MEDLLYEKLERHPNFMRLNQRRFGFLKIANYLENIYATAGLNYIVETGTARQFNNWEGDGQSTLVWDYLASVLSLHIISIDIDSKAVALAKSQVSDKVKFYLGDSVKVLCGLDDEIVEKIGVLYLDSFDWTPELNEQSSQHHLRELEAVYRRLSVGALIVVDDCHSDTQGKHIAVKKFFADKKIEPAFSGYQTGWVKRER